MYTFQLSLYILLFFLCIAPLKYFFLITGEGLKINFLSHYLESSGANFEHGVNFAVAGAATVTTYIPFPLSTQVLQFLHFKNKTRELRPQGLFL